MATRRRRYKRDDRVIACDGLRGRIVPARHGATEDGEPLYEVHFDGGVGAGIFREGDLTREPRAAPEQNG
jgi:hypothetical protein